MIVKGITINDLHFGIKDSKRLYEELSQFKDYLNNNAADLLVIDGDYFDCKLSIGDPASFYAMMFFKELVDIVKKKKIIFRMIQGTRSHELNQLQIFKPYENDLNMDFKIIETVSEEDLLGLHVLYVPEEYPENADEYYAEYKAKKYNIMFAHATFDFVAQPGQIEQSKKNTHTAPVLIWKEWKDALENGFATVGHIHGRNVYGKKIFYSGSFTRWNFGERSEKGFTAFEYNTETNEYNVCFINNDMAPAYDVVSVQELGLNLDESSVEQIKEAINPFIGEPKDNLRIDLAGLSKEKIEILKEFYKPMPNIKVEIRENKKALLKESAAKKEEFEKWHYITKRQLPIPQMIQKYCKEEMQKDLTLENINSAINQEA